LKFEVKTKKQLTHSAMSLFTKKPSSGEYDDNYMRNEFGRPDTNYPNVKGLRTSYTLIGFQLFMINTK